MKGQILLLRNASPDIPERSRVLSSATNGNHELLQPSDYLLPELNLDDLLLDQGRGLIRLLYTRISKESETYQKDLVYLKCLKRKQLLPNFSGNALALLNTPFVDPQDPELNVQSISSDASDATKLSVEQQIESNQLVDANVWVNLTMRQNLFNNYFIHLIETFTSSLSSSTAASATASIGCRVCGLQKSSWCECKAVKYCSSKCKNHDKNFHQHLCQTVLHQSQDQTNENK